MRLHDEHGVPARGFLIVGLIFAIVANILVIVALAGDVPGFPFAGNLVAIIVCAMVLVLILTVKRS